MVEIVSGFATLGLAEPLLASLTALGYEEPTPIQRAAIPPLLRGQDLLGQAATGTGKTAAFALPLLQRIHREKDNRTRALVLVPTRELAVQVAEAMRRYGQGLGTGVLAIYGGAPMLAQVKALQRGVEVVVATPGRALDHLRRGTLQLENIEAVVLDEADEMLDMGFAEELEALLAATPQTRQTALFSATLPSRILAIAGLHLREPVRLTIPREKVAPGALPKVRQLAYVVEQPHKLAALRRVLDVERPSAAIIFCRTRTEVDELTEALLSRAHQAEALHGGLSQEQRDRVMKRFRSGTTALLVATDVAARGLDIQHVSHVINFDVPSAPEAYVHRIGRTGRAGREGVALTFAKPREHRLLANIESLTRQRIEVARVPTVAELRERQIERASASVQEILRSGDFVSLRGVVESLAVEFDATAVAAAALWLALRDTTAGTDETEIPSAPLPGEKPRKKPAPRAGQTRPVARGRGRAPAWEMARIFIGAGKEAGIRPGDLVGAIANETGLPGQAIFVSQIADRHSIVEVPKQAVAGVVSALRATRIKGRKLTIRHERTAQAPAARAGEQHAE